MFVYLDESFKFQLSSWKLPDDGDSMLYNSITCVMDHQWIPVHTQGVITNIVSKGKMFPVDENLCGHQSLGE